MQAQDFFEAAEATRLRKPEMKFMYHSRFENVVQMTPEEAQAAIHSNAHANYRHSRPDRCPYCGGLKDRRARMCFGCKKGWKR